MKSFWLNYSLFALLLLLFAGCEEDEATFGELRSPTNLTINATVVGKDAENLGGDGSGQVNFDASADDAISYKFIFGDGREEVSSTGQITHQYVQTGLNSYTVTVVASGTGGLTTSTSIEIEVFSAFEDPEVSAFLTGGGSKTWYWAAVEPGHLGVGPNDGSANSTQPIFYAAVPFEKAGPEESQCLYMDELVFIQDGDQILYELRNMGQTYFNVAFESVVGGNNGFDFCYDFNTDGQKLVTLAPSTSGIDPSISRGTAMIFSDEGFMSYYIGANTYEIMEITEDRMRVRAIPGNDEGLAWYHTFTTTPPDEQGGDPELDVEYTNLVFEDEFDTPGAPDPSTWTYDIGTGNNGWGNGESQFYTDRTENVIVEDGLLKITARRENFSGAQFTSTRLKSEDLYEFQYGRVDIRAKLPAGGGTWPALWMLGGDFAEVGWPTTGEIDIMEFAGNRPGIVQSALHMPDNFAGDAITESFNLPTATDEFHVYSLNWSPDQITFLVDDEIYHIYSPNNKNPDNWPYDKPFFFILNVAMGGSFGGEIDPNFQESSMEVDYVRVYQ